MQHPRPPWHYLLLLILAGESVFILPFILPRVFRPTVLETFGVDNTELGLCFSAYGVVALFSYLLGGPLADKYAPRKLIAVALWLTALGGLYLASYPDYTGLRILYGYWGFTTIFLFWAPMIKAARVWGGPAAQGKAFGFLDGGRGLVGALFGALGVFILSTFLDGGQAGSDAVAARAGFRRIILVSGGLVAVAGALVWQFMRLPGEEDLELLRKRITVSQVRDVLRLPAVPLLMVIILCAYVGYKLTDIFSLYAREIMGYDAVASARVGTLLLFVRPVVGIGIGILADRTRPSWWLFVSFLVAAAGALLFATGLVGQSATLYFFLSTGIVALGVYAARALYFAVLEGGQVPLALTGTAVGLISLVGYTPDIFAGPAMGWLLDGNPGITGHRYVFWMLVGFSLVGAAAAGWYHRLFREGRVNSTAE